MVTADQKALSESQAGMRFIAQMKFYNDGNFERLRVFIQDSYSDALLAEQSAHARLNDLRERHAQVGRQKVKQVLAAGKHQVAVVLQAENTPHLYYAEVLVEEDYPHRILKFLHAPLQEASE